MHKINRITVPAIAALAAVLLAGAVVADVRLPHIFGDNMVLQSGKSTPVWGWATPGERVTVTLGGQSANAVADTDGKWNTALKNLKRTDTPVTVTIKGNNAITLKNVLIGDVWLGSGQSNMEWPMPQIIDGDQEAAKADYPNIRLFTVARVMKSQFTDDVQGKWQVCTPETIRGFSAVLYLYGREIFEKTRIPMGLIHSSVGGTRIELWTAPEGFETVPEFANYAASIKKTDEQYTANLPERLDTLETWIKSARLAIAENKRVPLTPDWPDHPTPEGGATQLYAGMIYPIVPFGLKGFVWYQGEWNGGEGDIYVKRMHALISGWRKVWNQNNLPFYYVQLARYPQANHDPWTGDGWAATREAQLKSLSIPNTGMAVIIDLEGSSDYHPRNKQDVSKRLALWALKNEYGMKSIVPSGPLYKSMKTDGNRITLTFDYTANGLIAGSKSGIEPVKKLTEGALTGFAIAGEDRVWHRAKAVIEGKTVVVSSAEVPNPVAVRYGYSQDPEGCNLYNSELLPATPFRTDTW